MLKFPYEFHFDTQSNNEWTKDFQGFKDGFIQVGPKKWVLPKKYINLASNIYNFKVRPSDVWMVVYPRSGSTLSQEMIWLIANNLDYETALSTNLRKRFPFFEYHIFHNPDLTEQFKRTQNDSPQKVEQIKHVISEVSKQLEVLEMKTDRRFIKTHLPFSLLPPDLLKSGCKVVYIARNPLDVAVSNYHFCQTARFFGNTKCFSKFWNYFKNDQTVFSPYWAHIAEGWERRHEKNLLFLFYEDLNADLQKAMRTVAKFLDKSLTTEQIIRLENHLKIDNFRNNNSVNNEWLKELGYYNKDGESFIRKGQCGEWRRYFNDEEVKDVEEWVYKNQSAIGVEFKL